MSPKYTHDCDICTFLGTVYSNEGHPIDLYVHADGIETYIARYSSDEPDYQSGKVFVGIDPYITTAHYLAQAKGIALSGVGQ